MTQLNLCTIIYITNIYLYYLIYELVPGVYFLALLTIQVGRDEGLVRINQMCNENVYVVKQRYSRERQQKTNQIIHTS